MATPKNLSVFKAFSVLKAFRHSHEWLSGSELSRRANLPTASGHRLIQSLEELGALVRGPNGRYRPGLLLVSLARNVVIEELLHAVSQPIIRDLAIQFDITVQVAMLEGSMVSYIAKASTPTSLPTCAEPGTQHEAYCSSLGKILLAELPPDQLEVIMMDGDLVALTPNTITDRVALREELSEVRRAGFAIDDREFQSDMWCMAVPVRDGDGYAVASIAAIQSANQMTICRQSAIKAALTNSAQTLSQRTSGQPLGAKRRKSTRSDGSVLGDDNSITHSAA
jgi:DNA-binding IclR family transcriptional regulator